MGNFVHLHVHTEYSILDGAARIKKLVKTCKEYGMPAVAITDHGNMYGAVQFYDECHKQGIKAIFGTEFYVCDDLTVKQGKTKLAHLILLAKNEQGYKNLCLLNSIAFRDGFYYKPRIDYKTLETHAEGLVCLSACLAGDIPQLILKRQFDEAERMVQWFKNLFHDDFYLELQNHHLEEQVEVNFKLKEYAKKYNIKTVATNDVHYIYREDAETQDVLMCVQMGKTIDDPDRLKFPCDEFYLKTEEEMRELFPADQDAIDTTMEIADKCNYEFVYGHYLFPRYIPENGDEPLVFLRKLIDAGIKKKYGEETKEIRDRIESELAVITKQGFVEYFLIVWDYINAARNMGISVGPGRGSGAGSVVAYTIGITNIDPLKYDLYFERFLNTERVSAPDFDVDFEDCRRQEVIGYVRKKYGIDRVVKIVTFGTMAAKNAIKDVGRVLKVPYSELDQVTKALPTKITKDGKDIEIKRPNILQKAFGQYHPKEGDKDYGTDYSVPELMEIYNNNSEIRRVVDIAIKLEDAPRQCSTHACGVIIGADILDRHIPLSRNGDDITTQYTGVELEHLGHLKMDFLGLRNLSDIKMCLDYIKENHGVEIDFDKSDYADPKVYELISSGNTKAIFQIESGGFQKFMKELRPTCLEDIVAGVSLYRPGPMDSIPRFVKNKHNPDQITYAHPLLEPILKQTYGCIVYQEQVMKIVQSLAGYTLGQADMVRRMMGKKKVDDMIKEEVIFINGKPETQDDHGKISTAIDGCLKRGVPEDVAHQVWNEMKDFAKYAFNKSHAAAYSLVTYQTAYLKCYYEPEFLTAVLNNRITNSDEIKNYVTYAKEEKIEVLPPDINKSQTFFSVKDGKIRFGLAALKGVGVGVVESIIAERNRGGDFVSIADFLNRVDTQAHNKRCLESFILSGAFDCFNVKRSQMMQVYSTIVDKLSSDRKRQASGQFSMFMDDAFKKDDLKVDYPIIPEYDNQTKLKLEKEVVGVYVTGHPLSNHMDKLAGYTLTADMLAKDEDEVMDVDDSYKEAREEMNDSGLTDGMDVTCGGIVTAFKKLTSKKSGKDMAIFTVEDLYGPIEIMMFPNVYEKYKQIVKTDALLTIKGKLSIRDGERATVLADVITPWEKTDETEVVVEKPKTLYLKYDATNLELHNNIYNLLSEYKGTTPVIVKCASTGKAYKLNLYVDAFGSLLDELHAYVKDEFIKLM